MGAKPFLYAAIPGRSPRAAWVHWAETKRPYSTNGDLPDGAHEVLADLISNGPASQTELKDHLQRSSIADCLKALLEYRFIVRAKTDADLAAAIDVALEDTKGAERLDNYQPIHEPLGAEDWALREYLNEAVSLPRGWRVGWSVPAEDTADARLYDERMDQLEADPIDVGDEDYNRVMAGLDDAKAMIEGGPRKEG